jgi:hypothetical protein
VGIVVVTVFKQEAQGVKLSVSGFFACGEFSVHLIFMIFLFVESYPEFTKP